MTCRISVVSSSSIGVPTPFSTENIAILLLLMFYGVSERIWSLRRRRRHQDTDRNNGGKNKKKSKQKIFDFM